MSRRSDRSIFSILISWIVGLVVFLTMLAVLNILSGGYNPIPIFSSIVGFLNDNLGLLILMSVLFLINDLFRTLFFPLNLPAPIFGAAGAVALVTFFFHLFSFIDEIISIGIFSQVAEIFVLPVYMLVFLAVLIGGYIALFVDLSGEA